jgi:L-ascorbate metabolism protein UlaG (beta-lactamase superfamily)
MTETSIERLASVGLSDGEAALSWFGQASFAARGGGVTVLFDPFLSPYDGRLHASPLAPEEAVGIDVVLCSHEHVDHLDVPSIGAIATASPGATFVVPSPIVDMVTEAGVPADRVVGMQPGEPIDVGGLTVRAVPACHGVTMDDAYGFGDTLLTAHPLRRVRRRSRGVRITTPATRSTSTAWRSCSRRSGSTSRCCPSTGETPSGRDEASSAT